MKKNKIVDIVEIIHNGIKVLVKIDYIENEISLVEEYNGVYTNKKWVFAERGAEFMSSWINIIEAQGVAIKKAKKMYEKELARTSEIKEKVVLERHLYLKEAV